MGDVSGRVFSEFGDYARMIPQWMDGPGVRTRIALLDDEPVGFAVTCLCRLPRPPHPEPDPGFLGLDLMAIAIVPERQGAGLGRRLLEIVLEEAETVARTTALPLVEVTLTVAETNKRARRLFESFGFRRFDATGGTYPAGQDALRMRRALEASGAPPGAGH